VGHPYDAEIAFVDQHLRRLLKQIDGHNLRERTLIVLASDHGEGLLDHKEELHGIFLYEATIRVALMFSNPLLFDRSYRVDDRVVGTVDILPTVLDLLGLPQPGETDGRSLLARDASPDRAIYIETLYPRNLGCADLRGLRRHMDKYIHAPRSEYYDLAKDPGELRDLYDGDNAALEKLRPRLLELERRWAEKQTTALAGRVLDPEEQQRLQALGYVTSGTGSESGPLPDPKDRIDLVNRMHETARLVATGQLEEALALAKEMAAQSEGWRMPVLMMAESLMRLGRNAERAEVLAEFCDRHPSAEMLFYLAHALFQLRRYEQCEQTLKQAELLDPAFGAVLVLGGDLYLAQRRYAEAVAQYEKAIALDGQRVGSAVRTSLAEARGRLDEASP
jgi:tetratricopeptide (TPR) repeat protein